MIAADLNGDARPDLVTGNQSTAEGLPGGSILLNTTPLPLTAGPSKLGFGSQVLGTIGAPQTITLENSTPATLPVTVDLSGHTDDMLISRNTCGGGVPADGTCAIAIRFAPGVTGARAASLTLDPAGPQRVEVALTGTRAAPPQAPAAEPGPPATPATTPPATKPSAQPRATCKAAKPKRGARRTARKRVTCKVRRGRAGAAWRVTRAGRTRAKGTLRRGTATLRLRLAPGRYTLSIAGRRAGRSGCRGSPCAEFRRSIRLAQNGDSRLRDAVRDRRGQRRRGARARHPGCRRAADVTGRRRLRPATPPPRSPPRTWTPTAGRPGDHRPVRERRGRQPGADERNGAGAGTPSFTGPTPFAARNIPFSITAVDVDSDGRPDLVTANNQEPGAGGLTVLRNTTSAGAAVPAFEGPTLFVGGASPRWVTSADVNADGRPDLAVANFDGAEPIAVLLNTTTGTTPEFSGPATFPAGAVPRVLTAADFNRDGRPDLVAANFNSAGSEGLSVLLNTTSKGADTAAFDGPTNFDTASTPARRVCRRLQRRRQDRRRGRRARARRGRARQHDAGRRQDAGLRRLRRIPRRCLLAC